MRQPSAPHSGGATPTRHPRSVRWVNVANWESEAHFRAAHGTDEFRRVVTQPGWEEVPRSLMLDHMITEAG